MPSLDGKRAGRRGLRGRLRAVARWVLGSVVAPCWWDRGAGDNGRADGAAGGSADSVRSRGAGQPGGQVDGG